MRPKCGSVALPLLGVALVLATTTAGCLMRPAGSSRARSACAVEQFRDACCDGSPTRVRKLLAARPWLLNAQDGQGNSGLHWAVLGDNIPVLDMLIKSGANLNKFDSINSTPLCEAAVLRNLKAARRLIVAGADVNAPRRGMAPLHHAVLYGDMEMVKLLVDAHADVNAPGDSDGMMTPLFCAGTSGHAEIKRYLVQHGATSLGRYGRR